MAPVSVQSCINQKGEGALNTGGICAGRRNVCRSEDRWPGRPLQTACGHWKASFTWRGISGSYKLPLLMGSRGLLFITIN